MHARGKKRGRRSSSSSESSNSSRSNTSSNGSGGGGSPGNRKPAARSPLLGSQSHHPNYSNSHPFSPHVIHSQGQPIADSTYAGNKPPTLYDHQHGLSEIHTPNGRFLTTPELEKMALQDYAVGSEDLEAVFDVAPAPIPKGTAFKKPADEFEERIAARDRYLPNRNQETKCVPYKTPEQYHQCLQDCEKYGKIVVIETGEDTDGNYEYKTHPISPDLLRRLNKVTGEESLWSKSKKGKWKEHLNMSMYAKRFVKAYGMLLAGKLLEYYGTDNPITTWKGFRSVMVNLYNMSGDHGWVCEQFWNSKDKRALKEKYDKEHGKRTKKRRKAPPTTTNTTTNTFQSGSNQINISRMDSAAAVALVGALSPQAQAAQPAAAQAVQPQEAQSSPHAI